MVELASFAGVVAGAAGALYLVTRYPANSWLGGKIIITVLVVGGYIVPRLLF